MFWEDHGRPTFVWLYHMVEPTLSLMPALALMLWAQWRLGVARRRASSPADDGAISGAEAATAILGAAGAEGVAVVPASGPLADFYDPSRREVRLSVDAFDGRAPAALAVAAHEAGHALQGRAASSLRVALIVASRLMAIAGWMTFAAGFAMDYDDLAFFGDRLLTAGAGAALALLPIGYDANRRALAAGALGGIEPDPAFLAALRAAPLAHVAALLPFSRRTAGRRAPTAVPAIGQGGKA